jgi:hypothetical protein
VLTGFLNLVAFDATGFAFGATGFAFGATGFAFGATGFVCDTTRLLGTAFVLAASVATFACGLEFCAGLVE